MLRFISEEFQVINDVRMKEETKQRSHAQANPSVVKRGMTAAQLFFESAPVAIFEHIADMTTKRMRKKKNRH